MKRGVMRQAVEGQRGDRVGVAGALGLIWMGLLVMAGSTRRGARVPGEDGSDRPISVDQNGVPFLIAGESPQAMIGDLSEADAELFFANRRSHGFNTVWINLLCAKLYGMPGRRQHVRRVPPFTTRGDFATPNEAYFARADRICGLRHSMGFW